MMHCFLKILSVAVSCFWWLSFDEHLELASSVLFAVCYYLDEVGNGTTFIFHVLVHVHVRFTRIPYSLTRRIISCVRTYRRTILSMYSDTVDR